MLITWLILKFFLKSKDVFYQVSSELGEVNSFYSSFSDASQKVPLPFQSSKKPAEYRVNAKTLIWLWSTLINIISLFFDWCQEIIERTFEMSRWTMVYTKNDILSNQNQFHPMLLRSYGEKNFLLLQPLLLRLNQTNNKFINVNHFF